MNPALMGAIGAVIGTAITGLAGIVTKRIEARSSQVGQLMSNELDWRKQLASEVQELKGRVEVLEERLQIKDRIIDSLGGFLDEMGIWHLYGARGEHPIPPEGAAADHYDRTRWLRVKERHDTQLNNPTTKE